MVVQRSSIAIRVATAAADRFTSKEYVEYLREKKPRPRWIKISMDGKGRALDNIFIERFWRTIKYRYIYLFPHGDGISLYRGIAQWMDKYNHRPHQGIGRQKPSVRYHKKAA